jgi:isopentenyldiphosphate isomerase
MAELINGFDATGKVLKVEERSRLNLEIRAHAEMHGDAHVAVECIYLMLGNSAGQLYVVQRAEKPENPWLWDKTVGGAVAAGEAANHAMLREVTEELGITAILVEPEEYSQSVAQVDLGQQAVVRQIAFDPWFRSERVAANGERWFKRHRVTVYAGRYDGPVRFADGEANDLKLLTLNELCTAMANEPDTFTWDLRVIIERYGAQLR